MHREWRQEAGGDMGSSCAEPMTRGALRSLRNSGGLSKDCHYIVTDYNRANVGSAEILLHAVNENSLSSTVMVKTGFDNIAWQGRYDIDANRLYHLADNVGNVVTGEATVDSFPWGVANVYENTVFESTLNYTSGQFYDNQINSSTVTITAGVFSRNNIDELSVVSVTNGANFYDNEVNTRARVTITSRTHLENKFDSSSTFNQVGTGYIRYSSVGSDASVTVGNTNITRTTFNGSSVNTTGSSGNISYSEFNRGVATSLQNIANLDITDSSISSAGTITANGATRLRLYRCTVSGGSRVLVSADATLISNYSEYSSYSYIQVLAGSLTAQYCTAMSLGYFRNDNGTNRLDRVRVSSQANVRFLGTSTGCRIYYSSANEGAGLYMTNATNCYMYYQTVDSIGQIYINDRDNARFYYNHCDSYSYIRSYGTGAGQSLVYYCSASSRGYIDHINIGARIRFYAVRAASQSIARQTGGAVNSNLYYSSFSSYYYGLFVLTGGTRSALRGTGRQNFNGMPVTNGAGARNWT